MKHELTQNKTLFVSAGHSNTDSGAAANGFTEADIVTEFRNMVCSHLDGKVGYGTDGKGMENMPLSKAAKLASAHDVAAEFHCNAATPAATGCETLSKSSDFPLAGKICNAISDTLGIRNRGSKPENSGQHSRLAFVSDGGGIIVELFFITSRSDLETYLARKDKLAKAVADVLIDAVTVDAYP